MNRTVDQLQRLKKRGKLPVSWIGYFTYLPERVRTTEITVQDLAIKDLQILEY